MHQDLNLKKDRGFTILEIIIAVFILVIAITASYSAFSGVITATSVISSRLTASYLAQEGIEIIRNIRDTKWLGCSGDPDCWNNVIVPYFNNSNCSSGCEADYTTGTGVTGETPLRIYTDAFINIVTESDGVNKFYSYVSGEPTKFKRKIIITSAGTEVLLVNVLVSWDDRGKSYSFTVEEYLYDWY